MTRTSGRNVADEVRLSRVFREQSRADFRHVGAIAPSGRPLALALAATIPVGGAAPRRILEVGAGTGAVTVAIVNRLGPADTLLIIERNPVFAECLRERVRQERVFCGVRDRVRILHADVESLAGESGFHAVVSSLPFNNFTPHEVAGHLRRFREMLVRGSSLAFFEYLWIRRLRGLCAGRAERARLYGVGRVIAEAIRMPAATSRVVLRNLPPAVVHTAPGG